MYLVSHKYEDDHIGLGKTLELAYQNFSHLHGEADQDDLEFYECQPVKVTRITTFKIKS